MSNECVKRIFTEIKISSAPAIYDQPGHCVSKGEEKLRLLFRDHEYHDHNIAVKEVNMDAQGKFSISQEEQKEWLPLHVTLADGKERLILVGIQSLRYRARISEQDIQAIQEGKKHLEQLINDRFLRQADYDFAQKRKREITQDVFEDVADVFLDRLIQENLEKLHADLNHEESAALKSYLLRDTTYTKEEKQISEKELLLTIRGFANRFQDREYGTELEAERDLRLEVFKMAEKYIQQNIQSFLRRNHGS